MRLMRLFGLMGVSLFLIFFCKDNVPFFVFIGRSIFHCSAMPSIFFGFEAVFGSLASLFFLVFRVIRLFFMDRLSLTAFTNGLPTLLGMVALREKRFVPILVLFGMFLFIMHPVGWLASPYVLLWVVPFVASFFDALFARMLVASFIAHIIGSLIWLYGGLLSDPAIWIALIPRVLVERLSIALGGLGFALIVKWARYGWALFGGGVDSSVLMERVEK